MGIRRVMFWRKDTRDIQFHCPENGDRVSRSQKMRDNSKDTLLCLESLHSVSERPSLKP